MSFMTPSSEPKCRLLYYNLNLQGTVSCHNGERNLFGSEAIYAHKCRPKHKYSEIWTKVMW